MKERKGSKLTAADFFAGIGGMRMGFEKSGFEIVYSNDIDKNACRTYAQNFGVIDCKDIKEVDTDKLPDFDVLLGGFPCQPYSMIGKRLGLNDERGKVFFQIVRILNAKRPSAFVLENVKHLSLYNKGEVLRQMIKNLEWLGYKVHLKVLDSQNFGVPQHRERLYIVGFLDSKKPFVLYERNKKTKLKEILEKRIDESYYLSEKYYRGLLKHKSRHAKGGNGFGCVVLDKNGVSNTLVAGNMGRERNLIKDKKVLKNRFGIRKLTVRECARLQGFPDSFQLPAFTTVAYKQLGNAVTVPVAKAVAGAVKRILLARDKKENASSAPALISKVHASKLEKASSAEGSERLSRQFLG
ncbi:MAG TPA: DNA (cytosine-5-)-methyltransferase [Candidatus Paceibacterota bacterium]